MSLPPNRSTITTPHTHQTRRQSIRRIQPPTSIIIITIIRRIFIIITPTIPIRYPHQIIKQIRQRSRIRINRPIQFP